MQLGASRGNPDFAGVLHLAVKGGVTVRVFSAKARITSDRLGVGWDGESAKPAISERWIF